GLTILDSVRKNLSGSTEYPRPGKDNGLLELQGYLKPAAGPTEPVKQKPTDKDTEKDTGRDKPTDGPITID
ncbi:hypothetical protein, partial [Streptomyces sp. H39-C1]